jgi:hypothetical protein
MRWVVCAVTWVVCLAAALWAAAETKLGRILVQLSPNHGIHLGDVLAVVLGASLAALVTLVAWITRPPRRATVTAPAVDEGDRAAQLAAPVGRDPS